MNPAKITLSEEEMELVQNARWLLTKNTIIEKVYGLFGDIAQEIRLRVDRHEPELPDEVAASSPKISRGENYKGLPYVMLDYPRLFGKEDIYAIRLMFWWGHFFSCTLHLKGKYHRVFAPCILQHLALLKKSGFHICTANDEWRHDFEADNYTPLSQLNAEAVEAMLSANGFCKLSARLPLQQWDKAKVLLPEMYEVLFTVTSC